MDHIFGDTDDITFGSSSHSAPKPRPHDIKQTPIRERSGTTQNPKPLPKRETPPRPSRPTEMVSPIIPELDPLTRLVNSMKASFLPKEDDMNTVRMVILSEATHTDPLILTTRDDETILIGSGFSSITRAGKLYSTFPDMRLVFSEKEHLSAWVLTDETIDIHPILSILPSLGFPPIYAPRGVIAKFREEIKDTSLLEKCRFFELFAGGMSDRRIGTFEFSMASCEGAPCFTLRAGGVQVGIGFIRLAGSTSSLINPEQIIIRKDDGFMIGNESFSIGEILLLRAKNITKHVLKYTFDTFYIDGNSVGVVAGYTLPDREQLAENGILTFTLEEDMRARTIAGHIFIDSRGFVHAYEMMAVHKEILKGIRATYEKLILDNQRIERGELVQSLRREITKYCYVLTGRTPVVMPIVIER